MRSIIGVAVSAAFVVTTLGASQSALADVPYSQGFESDAGGWTTGIPIQRVQANSGPLGITASSGNYYGVITDPAGYTYLGGRTNTFPGVFYQSLDIYIDTAWNIPTAQNGNVGFKLDMAPAYISTVNGGGSNAAAEQQFLFYIDDTGNSVRVQANGRTGNGQDIVTLTESGWYTFRMTYVKGTMPSDPVEVYLSVYDENGMLLGTQMRPALGPAPHNPDSSALGGNSYIWFPGNEWNSWFLNTLAIDNARAMLVASVAATDNQRAAAGALLALGSGNALYWNVVLLGAPGARQAYDALSGEYYASRQTAMLSDSRYLRQAVTDRLGSHCAGSLQNSDSSFDTGSCDGTVWMRAYGAWTQFDGDDNTAGLDHDSAGFFIGADKQVSPGVRVGFVFGYGHGTADVDKRDSSGANDSYRVGLYTGLSKGALNMQAGIAHAWHDLDSERGIHFPGFSETVAADYHANTTQLFFETSYDLASGDTTLAPFVRGAYVHLDTNGFTEDGGLAALTTDEQSSEIGISLVGLRLAGTLNTSDTATVRARALIGWHHVFGDVTPEADVAFNNGQVFTVSGVPLASDALALEAGLDARIGGGWTFGVSYVGLFGSGVESNGVKASLAWHF